MIQWISTPLTLRFGALQAVLSVAVLVQMKDAMMDCTAINAEIAANTAHQSELGSEKGGKVAQNVAAGVAGLLIPVLWFGMDFQGAADTESRALEARDQYLSTLALQRCPAPQQTAVR